MRIEHTQTVTRHRVGQPRRVHPGRLTEATVDLSDREHLPLPVLWQLEISHYNEKVRWALDYKHAPHIRRSLLPGLHIVKAKRLTGDTSTTPVLTLKGRSIGDSTRIIAAIEEHWPQPPLYPEDAAQRRRALELEEFFDEELGPHIRRAFYQELLPHPELVVPLFTYGRPHAARALLRAGFPMLLVAMRQRFEISAESAAASRAKMVAAMDRLEHEISPSGYLVGDTFTVADLTAAALFYAVPHPPEFPYPMVADHDLPDSWRDFLHSLAASPATGRSVARGHLPSPPWPVSRSDARVTATRYRNEDARHDRGRRNTGVAQKQNCPTCPSKALLLATCVPRPRHLTGRRSDRRA